MSTTMGSAAFIEAVKAKLQINGRHVWFRNRDFMGGYTSVVVNYINLPEEIHSRNEGNGAESENNRMMFSVTGFHPTDPTRPPMDLKVKVELHVSSIGREYNLRAKTATPEKIAEYLAAHLNKVAAEVEPKFTHTRPSPEGA